MSFAAGRKLGPYEIVEPIGKGGMGEVYRARDTKLDRDVAIKVLPEEFAEDDERLARFEREAKLLASLNHPNIASIYGFEEGALVLELVEGPTLAERIDEGPIPIDEAIAIAKQIAEALEAGHEAGVIHRDLKPANIKLKEDGAVKVLDYGLAKAFIDEAQSGSDSEVSDSPTLTRQGTELGMILGTAAYMSPEQARGRRVDRRADVWAFGVVLFEMLTGKRLFAAESASDTLAAVLRQDVDWTALPASTPRSVRETLRRCLERALDRRLRHVGDARLLLEDVLAGDDEDPPRVEAPWKRALPWGVAAAAILVAASSLMQRSENAPTKETMYLDVPYPADVEPVFTTGRGFALAQDGRSVAVIGSRQGVRRLFISRLDRPEAIEVPGSRGTQSAGFSPDGESVAVILGGGSLVRISLADGQRAIVTGEADNSGDLEWGESGIVFARRGALWIVPPEGGEAKSLTTLDASRQEVWHAEPVMLPGGHAVLFASITREGTERIESVSLDGGSRTVLVERANSALWSPTGHVLFARDGAILAAPFDPKSLSVGEPAVPVIPAGVTRRSLFGGVVAGLSPSGNLALIPSDLSSTRVISVRRDGSVRQLEHVEGTYFNPRVSPDGRRLLLGKLNVIEALDLVRGTRERLSAEAFGTSHLVWSSDGQRVVFRRFQSPMWLSADGSGEEGAVPATSANDYLSGAGPDPDSVLSTRIRPETGADVFLLSLSGSFEPRPLVATSAYEGGAHMAPDGRWLLYQSDDSGQAEVYVARYPELNRRFQVSAGGGFQPRWSRSGDEIYYRDGEYLTAVSFDGSGIEPVNGIPEPLFSDEYQFGFGLSIANYDVTPDGRFIMLRTGSRRESIRLVLNWVAELERLLAQGGVR